jgi:hypothetical protein
MLFVLRGPEKKGLMYSHTIALSGVTSKTRPGAPSVISVLPFGRRCAPLILVLKKFGA